MVTLAPNPDEAAEAAARRAAMRQRIAAASAQAEIDPAQHAPLLDIADEALAAKMPDLACWAWALAGSTLGRAGHYSSAQDLLNRCVSRARRERLRNWLLLAELYRAHVWYQQGLHDRSLAALLRLAQPHRLQQLELIQRLDVLRSLADLCCYADQGDAGMLCWALAERECVREGLPMPGLMLVLRALHRLELALFSSPLFEGMVLAPHLPPEACRQLLAGAAADVDAAVRGADASMIGVRLTMAAFTGAAIAALRNGDAAAALRALAVLREASVPGLRFDLRVRLRTAAVLLATGEHRAAAEAVAEAPAYPPSQVDTEELHRWLYVRSLVSQRTGDRAAALAWYQGHATMAVRHLPQMNLRAREALRTLTPLPGARPRDDPSHRPAYLERALACLGQHQGCVTVAQVAAHAGVPERTLREAFQVHIGTSPKQHALQLRLDAAYAYLKAATDDEPLDAVAARFGFNHPGRFTAQFRARFGINPGGARRRPRTGPGA